MAWKVKLFPILLKWPVLKMFSEFAVLFTPVCLCSWNDWSSLECSLVGWSQVPKCFFSLEFHLNMGKNCSCVTIIIIVVSITRKEPFLTHVFLYTFSIAQAEFYICCKAITGLCKNVFFIYSFHVPRYENGFQKCPTFRFSSTLSALLIRSGNAFLGNIITSLCCSCDTETTCKRSF